MSGSPATVTASGIASLAGVGRAAVSNWRRRYSDFPQPMGGTATSPSFDLRSVENWLQEQGKVPEIPAEERTWRRIEAFGMPEHAGDAMSLTGAFLLAEASRHPEASIAREAGHGAEPITGLLPARDLAARVDRWGEYARNLLVQMIPREWSAQQEELLGFARELARRRGAEEAFEYLCSRYAVAGTLPGHYATPPAVAELMLDLAGDAGAIIDFACGSGNILRTAANRGLERGAPVTCYGQDVSKTQARITLLRLLFISSRAGSPDGESGPHIATGDSLLADAFPGLAADVAVASPPFGIHDWGRDRLAYDSRWAFGGLPPRTEPELAWVQHALAHVVTGGRAVLLMPPAAAKRPAGRKIRGELVRRGALQAVIALPPGSLPTTGISLHLWVLRKPRPGEPAGQVLFVDSATAAQQAGPEFAAVRQIVRQAWSAYQSATGNAERPGESGAVPAIDLLDDEVDLTPSSRLRPAQGGTVIDPRDLVDAAEEIRATLGMLGDSLPRLRVAGQNDTAPAWAALEDLVRSGAAEIHRPAPLALPGSGKPGTGHFEVEVTSQDILRGRPPSGAVPLDPQVGDPARVQSGDVLIAAGLSSMARVATAQQVGAVPGRGVWVVRVDPQVMDPWFLAGAISGADSRRIPGQVTSTLSGTPRADVRRFQIPVLPIESQRLYGNAYRRIAEFETLVLQAAERSSDIARELASGLVNQTIEPDPEPGQ
ncbi:MAG TPA: N-6 DNA methylase [Streptosporangiaceae bacterium]|nr:N-6 DNA methylase [Streptosporangiaceae bacterium]